MPREGTELAVQQKEIEMQKKKGDEDTENLELERNISDNDVEAVED